MGMVVYGGYRSVVHIYWMRAHNIYYNVPAFATCCPIMLVREYVRCGLCSAVIIITTTTTIDLVCHARCCSRIAAARSSISVVVIRIKRTRGSYLQRVPVLCVGSLVSARHLNKQISKPRLGMIVSQRSTVAASS